MKKHPEVTAQTRQNLMDAFWAIYTVKRIEKITVKEIAAKAGYNRSTFYEYFTDAYNVLDEIESELIPNVDELPAFATASGDSLGAPLADLLELYEKNEKYYSILLGDKGDPAFAAKLKNKIKASLIVLLRATPENYVELDYTLEYVISAMVGVMSYWFRCEQNISKERLMGLIASLSKHGMGAPLAL